jgi:hypothetical protein
MRTLTITTVVLALLAACADSGEGAAPPPIGDDVAPPPGEADAALYEAGGEAETPRTARICTDDGWCHTDVPSGHTLLDVWSDTQGSAWAVSEEGGILRWDGLAWSVHFTNMTKLVSIWGSGPNDLWAGGPGGLLHGDGTEWRPVPLEAEGDEALDITGGAASDVWVAGKSAGGRPRVFHVAGAGGAVTSEPIEDALAAHEYYDYFTDVRRVWKTTNGDVWVCVSIIAWDFIADYLYRRPAGTSSEWQQIPFPSEFAKFDYSDQKFTGAGATGDDVWLFANIDDVGASYWTAKTGTVVERTDWKLGRWKHPLDREFDKSARTGIWGVSANDVWVIGTVGRIQHWDGASWTLPRVIVDDVPIGEELRAVAGQRDDDLWVVGGRYALHRVSKTEADRWNAEYARKDGGS